MSVEELRPAELQETPATGGHESRGSGPRTGIKGRRREERRRQGGRPSARAEAKEPRSLAYDQARDTWLAGGREAVQAGKLGVICPRKRRTSATSPGSTRPRFERLRPQLLEFGGVWIDEGFDAKTPTLTVKVQSDAYFSCSNGTTVKDVFTLGNHLVWVTPSGTALIIDAGTGKETLGKEEIEALFVAKK